GCGNSTSLVLFRNPQMPTIDVEHLSEQDQEKVFQAAQEIEANKSAQSQIFELSDFCFKKCVTRIKSDALDKESQVCIMNCAGRFLDLTDVLVKASITHQE
ncbi:hypothetical protein HDU91_000159, partial [Kappamyces sp. JEL0680]